MLKKNRWDLNRAFNISNIVRHFQLCIAIFRYRCLVMAWLKKTNPKPILTAGSIVSSCKVISHLNNFHNAPKTIKSKKLSPFTPFHGSWYTANHKFYCMLYVKNLMCHLQFLQFWLDSFCERQKYQSKCLTATVNGTRKF